MGQVSRQTKLTSAWFIFLLYTRYIDIETGRRSDTAHHYIYNQDHNTNLKILVRHCVVHVILEYAFVFRRWYQKFSHIMIPIMVGVPVLWELNMLTIQLEGQRVLLSHSWPKRHSLLSFLLERSELRLSLRDQPLAQRMSWWETIFIKLLISLELENTIWVRIIECLKQMTIVLLESTRS